MLISIGPKPPSSRSRGVLDLSRASASPSRPPFPLRTFPTDFPSSDSSNSPIAILATIIAHPTVSAGRFSPRGPRGISAVVSSVQNEYDLDHWADLLSYNMTHVFLVP